MHEAGLDGVFPAGDTELAIVLKLKSNSTPLSIPRRIENRKPDTCTQMFVQRPSHQPNLETTEGLLAGEWRVVGSSHTLRCDAATDSRGILPPASSCVSLKDELRDRNSEGWTP